MISRSFREFASPLMAAYEMWTRCGLQVLMVTRNAAGLEDFRKLTEPLHHRELLGCAEAVRHCNAAIFLFRRLFDDLVGERSPCSGDQGS